MEHQKILLVEDEELVRGYLAQLLQKARWHVTPVRSGTEALAVLAETRFDIILCDLDLGSGPNGIDVQRNLPERSRGTPVVILTAHGTIERCKDAMRHGVCDFLEKPMSPLNLLAVLQAALDRRQSTDQTAEGYDSVPLPTAGDDRLRAALKTIERQYADPDLCVSVLAQCVGVSPEHLARLCRLHTGKSPLEQIHFARVNAAKRLLANPSLSIYEVALESGYRRTQELSEWFRRFNQVTPSEWRQQPRRSD